MKQIKYTTMSDGRIYRWVRTAPGPKGRHAVKGRTPEEVEEKVKAILEAAAPSQAPSDPIDYYAPGTFGRFVYEVYCPRTYADARGTTKDLYDVYFRYHILPVLGDVPIAEISYDHFVSLEGTLMNRRNPGRPLAKKTKREIMMRVREVMNLHVMLEKGKGVAPREDWRVHRPPKAPKKKAREEVQADYSVTLLKAAAGTWMEGPLYCILFLMFRRGEVCGMKARALDRKRMRVRILEQRHPRLEDGATPKGDKTRDLPVPPEVFAAIERLRDKNSIYLWTKDGQPINPDQLTHEIPDLCVRAGLARKTPHELRALGATNLISIGTNPVAVMELLGHAELDTSLIYFDPRAEEKRGAFKRLLAGEDLDGENEGVG